MVMNIRAENFFIIRKKAPIRAMWPLWGGAYVLRVIEEVLLVEG